MCVWRGGGVFLSFGFLLRLECRRALFLAIRMHRTRLLKQRCHACVHGLHECVEAYDAFDVVRKREHVQEFVRFLRTRDWGMRHLYFDQCLKRNPRFAADVRQVMGCDEIRGGLDASIYSGDAIPLPASAATLLRAERRGRS